MATSFIIKRNLGAKNLKHDVFKFFAAPKQALKDSQEILPVLCVTFSIRMLSTQFLAGKKNKTKNK